MELVRKSIPYYDVILDNISVYEESADAIVPDAFPDIGRLVYAGGIASIKDQSPQNDRLLVSGAVAVTVLYQPEPEGHLQRLEIPLSFAYIEEAKGVTADSLCFVRCHVAGVNARAVNSRKVSVTAKLCFETAVYQPATLQYTEQVDGGELPLEILYDTQELTLLQQVCCDSFPVLDDIEWSGAEGLELLHTDCCLKQNECRSMNGRLFLRGEAALQLLLQDDAGMLQQVSKSIPFTQMLDIPDLKEGQSATVRLAVRNLDCVLSASGVLSAGIGVQAAVLWDETHTLQTIRDLYQTQYALNVQAGPVQVHECALCGDFTAEGMENVPLGMKASQYLGAKAVCTELQGSPDSLRAKVAAEILYYDDQDSLYQLNRMLEIPLRTNGLPPAASLCDLDLQVSLTPAGEDSANLHFAVCGSMVSRPAASFSDVTDVQTGAARTPASGGVTLILRRTAEGEDLWELAKQYATTVAAIRAANHLAEGQTAAGDAMLLIPMES